MKNRLSLLISGLLLCLSAIALAENEADTRARIKEVNQAIKQQQAELSKLSGQKNQALENKSK